ncbi:MAG: hypothetical protein WD431_05925, partial [Cyclobacteriaceae bacterium]
MSANTERISNNIHLCGLTSPQGDRGASEGQNEKYIVSIDRVVWPLQMASLQALSVYITENRRAKLQTSP